MRILRRKSQKGNFPIIVTVVLIVLLISSARSIKDSKKSLERVSNINEELNSIKSDNLALKNQIEYVQTEEYLEKTALEELNLTKPGYTVLIMEPKLPILSETENDQINPKTVPPNWKLWANIIGL